MSSSFIRAILLSTLSPIAFVATPALAQDSGGASQVPETADETIIVTGTRRTDRTLADSPVPVDVISAESLTTSGFTETNRLLAEQVPSFNFPQPSISDGTDVVRPATLRGLNPDQTLVLINGKRRHTSALLNINGSVGRGTAAVDINLIPSIALNRVEVLRDGAAAQYGSDAIAGVINFQLRDKPGSQLTVTYGQYDTRVDGVQRVTGLVTNAAGQPLLAPDGTYQVTTTGKDRHASDGQTLTVAGTIGLPMPEGSYFNVSAEYQDRNPTNRTGDDRRRQFNLIGGLVDARELTFDRLTHRYGDAKTQDMKLFANFGAEITPAVELYGFASYGFRDGESAGFYRLANDARNVPALYPNGFLPLITTELNDFAGTVGLRGEVSGFTYDLSGGFARNAFDFQIENTLNASYGPASQLAFDAGGLRYTQAIGNFDVSHKLEFGFAKEVTIAAGLEYRRETFEIRPGEPASYNSGGRLISQNQPGGAAQPAAPGAQVFPGFQPIIGGQRVDGVNARHNFSGYVELDADISDRFNIQLAGRYEDYSDFGSDLNGKAAARFEVFDGLALRGALSTGFRAPSLQQQYYAAQATNNVNGVLLDTVTLPVNNPVAVALGATPLDPETSVSYSAGVVFTAVPRLNVTVDFYQVDIDDRIVVTDNLTANRAAGATGPGAAIATILNNAGFSTVSAARFFVNGLDSRTRGVDAVGTYRFDLGSLGRLTATAGFNYNKTTIQNILAAPGPLANIPGLVLFGRQEQGRLVRGQPRTKINAGLDYDMEPVGVTLRANRYGKVEGTGGEIGPAGGGVFNDNFLKAQWVVDAEVRFTFAERFSFAVGANNLLDSYPTLVPTGLAGVSSTNGANVYFPTTNYVAPYSNFSPNGFNGRFLYGRVTAKF